MRRRKKNNDLVIDLTSLLDVIFILLLVILCGEQLAKQEYITKEQQASEVVQEAEAAKGLYEDQMELSDNINNYVCAISVYSDYNPDQITVRKVRILKENEEIESYDLIGADTKEAYEAFAKRLAEYVEASAEQPVILSLNEGDEKILYRDEKAILQIFEQLSDEYENVYIK